MAELTRILLEAPDGEMVDAVKARFSLHAGISEITRLVETFENPPRENVRQRIIDLFSTLQSEASADAARQIVNDAEHSGEDPLVSACAISLVRRGQQRDLEMVFQRLNAAGDDPQPEDPMNSETAGWSSALRIASNPELEGFLIDAAAGNGAATTSASRAAAAAALCNYPSMRVTEVLYDLSIHEADPLVRRRAEESLEFIRTPE